MKPQPASVDRPLTYFALAGFLAACGLLGTNHSPVATGIAPEKKAGTLSRKLGNLTRREQGSLVWRPVRDGTVFYEGDSVFTDAGASGAIRLEDGSVLELDESSLVVLERVAKRDSVVRLENGSVRGEASRRLDVRSHGTTTRIGVRGAATVSRDAKTAEVFAEAGSVLVTPAGEREARPLASGVAMRVSADGSVSTQHWPIRLTAPDNGSFVRHRAAAAPEVTLSWRGEDPDARSIRLACGHEPVALVPIRAAMTRATVAVPRSGVCRWRIVDRDGRERSEERRFAVVEDRPPVALQPVGDQLLVSPAGRVTLMWKRVDGAESHRVEIALDPSFDAVVLTRDVENVEQLVVELPENERRWHWRVRGMDGRTTAPWSSPEAFRVTAIASLAAPSRLDSEVRFDAVP